MVGNAASAAAATEPGAPLGSGEGEAAPSLVEAPSVPKLPAAMWLPRWRRGAVQAACAGTGDRGIDIDQCLGRSQAAPQATRPGASCRPYPGRPPPQHNTEVFT